VEGKLLLLFEMVPPSIGLDTVPIGLAEARRDGQSARDRLHRCAITSGSVECYVGFDRLAYFKLLDARKEGQYRSGSPRDCRAPMVQRRTACHQYEADRQQGEPEPDAVGREQNDQSRREQCRAAHNRPGKLTSNRVPAPFTVHRPCPALGAFKIQPGELGAHGLVFVSTFRL
jgi:hypothetical protein